LSFLSLSSNVGSAEAIGGDSLYNLEQYGSLPSFLSGLSWPVAATGGTAYNVIANDFNDLATAVALSNRTINIPDGTYTDSDTLAVTGSNNILNFNSNLAIIDLQGNPNLMTITGDQIRFQNGRLADCPLNIRGDDTVFLNMESQLNSSPTQNNSNGFHRLAFVGCSCANNSGGGLWPLLHVSNAASVINSSDLIIADCLVQGDTNPDSNGELVRFQYTDRIVVMDSFYEHIDWPDTSVAMRIFVCDNIYFKNVPSVGNATAAPVDSNNGLTNGLFDNCPRWKSGAKNHWSQLAAETTNMTIQNSNTYGNVGPYEVSSEVGEAIDGGGNTHKEWTPLNDTGTDYQDRDNNPATGNPYGQGSLII